MAQSGPSANQSKVRSFKSAPSVTQFPSSPSKKKSAVYCVDEEGGPPRIIPQQTLDEESDAKLFTAKRMLIAVWMCVGLMPLLLQTRSYLKFVTPHKISQNLIVPTTAAKLTEDMEKFCPMEGLVIAGAWWNVALTHYHKLDEGRVCHFVVPQYNIHGNYVLGTKLVAPSKTSPASCSGNSYYLEYYFYHGSIGYYAFYEEAVGTLCADDNIGYVLVGGLGTYDSNGAHLAMDSGDSTYRLSYWYGMFGSVWIMYRSILLRRSYISCTRYGRRCDRLQEPMQFKDAIVFVQESMRLSAHGARNYHRVVLIYLLVEGLMSDLFMLIAQDGLLAKVQYISLGYNLSGVLSMLFEMVETMNWMRETVRCLIKRLLFNYETALLGELACSAAMQFYLTGLNKSSLQESKPVADAVSYYVWSLVGHGIIVLGIVFVITSIRSIGAIISVRWTFGSFLLLWTPCCVDTAIGQRCKMILLSGYVWEDDRLCYKAETLKSFGILKMVEEDSTQFIVLPRLRWLSISQGDLMVIGEIHGNNVTRCDVRPCTGMVSMIGKTLGGAPGEDTVSCPTRVAIKQRVPVEPTQT
ncbi:hypothetical protein F441_06518 [Phytophthora nicotianae CJ01A1]|uniref:Uncharacterized protein n=6 Tax=Phytophthora nicotianae TaxID=4792 RepID=W2RBP8_PHYN3|nr:hypothetical protein PPTG_02614 [Phytophthora nicotianae INRA-310]ETI49721.1 hypothetical protein F443_06515 [Phytophthora nicotianae P1569]ETK89605.1 hypothetical protein L915_06381 [Phytophthora nicotianae]ETO78435.1 hypothetical protein F444_06581 [Phytophthora nicotianae P1976]ETP19493.1 hypothetical protein F441_06518 [Phytophthora nicotianae CJ01A1]ETP47433.1 hypothetical protein F442_06558 [Phytophthora nicotianae P10297]KUF79999.1 hypothetical protein AM587_10017614 [Phytophthora n